MKYTNFEVFFVFSLSLGFGMGLLASAASVSEGPAISPDPPTDISRACTEPGYIRPVFINNQKCSAASDCSCGAGTTAKQCAKFSGNFNSFCCCFKEAKDRCCAQYDGYYSCFPRG